MLVLSALVMIFHLAVLAGVVPADIVWGGRTGSRSELVAMETVSLAVNAFLALTVLLRTGRIRSGIPGGSSSIGAIRSCTTRPDSSSWR